MVSRATMMRGMGWKTIAAFALFAAARLVHACSIAPTAYERFDAQEYVLYGEVVGYVSLEKPLCKGLPPQKCSQAWGLAISVLDTVFAPREMPSGVELYFFGSDAACFPTPMGEDGVREIPIGTRFRVVSKPLTAFFGPGSPTGAVRLHADIWTDALVARIPPDADIRALRDSRADYRGWRTDFSRYERDIQFELRKDMVRLHNSSSDAEAKSVLSRLAEHHWLTAGYRAPAPRPGAFERLAAESLSNRGSFDEIEARFWKSQCIAGMVSAEQAAQVEPRRPGFVNPELQSCLGERLAASKPEQAILWFDQASKSNFMMADYRLGQLYAALASKAEPRDASRLNGLSSAAYRRAGQKARRLEEKGDPWAPFVLAELYHAGLGGLPKDSGKALFLVCRYLKNKPPDYPRQQWWPRLLETCQ